MLLIPNNIRRVLAAALLPGVLAACGAGGSSSTAQNTVDTPAPGQRTACANNNPLRNPYFGDLHVHTVFSLDANTQGTVTHPRDAYRYAKGETLGIQPFDRNGEATRTTRLLRPLDFAAVTDHAELFGEVEVCTNERDYPLEYNSLECQFFRASPENAFLFFNLLQLGLPLFTLPPELRAIPLIDEIPLSGAGGDVPRLPYCGLNGETCLRAARTPWREIQAAAEEHYDRSENCSFTTFVGYEYSGAPRSFNLHRNVIFRSEVVPDQPPAYQEHTTPEKLWQALSNRCRSEDGCDYLTIPHNSNLSGGLMFEVPDSSRAYAETRQLNEPLAEIYQHKGQSECLNTVGAGMQDELCGFEVVPYDNLSGNRFGGINSGPPKQQDYLREALKEGIRRQNNNGVNPFKYGLIGGTDTHLGAAGLTLEKDYPGHGGASTASAGAEGLTDEIEYSPGGLAVLWAAENSRDSLYAAMRRREAYGTSGTRPIVRFFGGWDLPADMCSRSDYAETGYARGVPMGADLPSAPAAAVGPSFSVSALRDPGLPGSNAQALQRIQIIKGWVENGEKQETVIEVAGDPNNGAGVNLNTCETSGAGFNTLCGVWQDPDFSPDENAFYYARVVENPSCRWATRQCLAAGIDEAACADLDSVPEGFADCCNADFPKTIQERAWTSPIWYSRADES